MIYNGYAGRAATLDGETLTLAVMAPSYTPSPTDPDLIAIAAHEHDGSGYARDTFDATWDTGTLTLHVDQAERLVALFDLAGDDVGTYVIADATGDLIAWFSITPTAGYDGWPIAFPAGIIRPGDTSELVTRIGAVETDVTALELRTVAGVSAVSNNYPAASVAAAVEGLVEIGVGQLDATGTPSGTTYLRGDGTWSTPAGGGAAWGAWQAGSVAQIETRTDDTLVKLRWVGGAVAVATSTPGVPVLLGTLFAAHRPPSWLVLSGHWNISGALGNLIVIADDNAGSGLGTPGGLWVLDGTETLDDTDSAEIKFNGTEWWIA